MEFLIASELFPPRILSKQERCVGNVRSIIVFVLIELALKRHTLLSYIIIFIFILDASFGFYSPDSSVEPVFVLQVNFFKPIVTFCSSFL